MRLSLVLVDLVADNSKKLDQIQVVGFELVLTRTEMVVSAVNVLAKPLCWKVSSPSGSSGSLKTPSGKSPGFVIRAKYATALIYDECLPYCT